MMLAIANSNSGGKRYTILPQKTNNFFVCNCYASKNTGEKKHTVEDGVIEPVSETTHLGLLRSEIENVRNIEDRLSLARRTGYSLMKSGFQGTNIPQRLSKC